MIFFIRLCRLVALYNNMLKIFHLRYDFFYIITLLRKMAFLIDENAYSSLHVENDCSRLLNQNMEQLFE